MMTFGEADTRRHLDDMEVKNALKVDLIGKGLIIVLKDLWYQVKNVALIKNCQAKEK